MSLGGLALAIGVLVDASIVMVENAYRHVSEPQEPVAYEDQPRVIGGVILQWVLGYNFSVAVWVGYIALYRVAVQTGVVMVVYLHEALDKRLRQGGEITQRDVLQATIDGSVLRLRPKLMTVTVVLASLVPIMWSTGVGSDVMKPIAAPIVGRMITSTIHVLIITPVIFYIMKLRALRKGTLRSSSMTI
jgi:Cu(I)/Ag(I) efflux system membrane protein CusA/SilA